MITTLQAYAQPGLTVSYLHTDIKPPVQKNYASEISTLSNIVMPMIASAKEKYSSTTLDRIAEKDKSKYEVLETQIRPNYLLKKTWLW
ncbi:hypothetical protein ABK905_05025 [Acerihabitans sp. KWT182]|uniref:Uncharacterized protein n=1 Tax=Acerihabitans sp. KWT182 TaxID=3157919 RepID=A0AAU7QBM3_9GAMM